MTKKIIGDIKIQKKEIKNIETNNKEPILEIKNENNKINNELIYSKPLKQNSKLKKIIFIIIKILFILYVALYFFSKNTINIEPSKNTIDLNESVTLSSWKKPIQISIATFNEEIQTLDQDNDNEKIKEKISLNLKKKTDYDIPKDFILVKGCSNNILYTGNNINKDIIKKDVNTTNIDTENGKDPINTENKEIVAEEKDGTITGELTLIIVNKKSLEDYLIKVNNIKDAHISDISKIKCELKNNINKNTKATDVAFVLTGNIETTSNINKGSIIYNNLFKSFRKIKYSLDNNKGINNYSINTSPFNIFPISTNIKKHINIIVGGN